jgi:hypothetical protein
MLTNGDVLLPLRFWSQICTKSPECGNGNGLKRIEFTNANIVVTEATPNANVPQTVITNPGRLEALWSAKRKSDSKFI